MGILVLKTSDCSCDKLTISKRGKKITFSMFVDQTGNEIIMDFSNFKNLLDKL